MTRSDLLPAVAVELLKARRSKMPLLTALGFSLAPLAGGFFMFVLKDPEFARRAGLISAKAQMAAGSADWPTYLTLLAQATAVGGILLFGLIGSWVFGREFSDHTVKDLLALPTARSTIVLAKFILIVVWSAALVGWNYVMGLAVGAAVGLPQATMHTIVQGSIVIGVTACLTIALMTPIAFLASAGRGYLAPIGASLLMVALAQMVALAGWGDYFPWSIPALYAGIDNAPGAGLGTISYAIVLLTSLLGIAATFLWWELADQSS